VPKNKPFKPKKQAPGSKLPEFHKLNNGTMMPTIGFGTAACQDPDSMFNAIMKAGYAHIDTAHVYQNEQVVGDVLQRCFKAGKKREELHVATKLHCTQYNDVEGALKS